MPDYCLTPSELEQIDRLIETAIDEDLQNQNDLTTHSLVPESAQGTIQIVGREPGTLAGAAIAERIFSRYGQQNIKFHPLLKDGDALIPGTVIAEVSGSMQSILTLERTVLNFLTLLSGTATLTRRFVDAVKQTQCQILETRKTLPGLRAAQKFAVRCGGGTNHRIGLYDAVLIKDNHLAWLKTRSDDYLAEAVREARSHVASGVIVEIEVDTIEQLRSVLPSDPDIVLMDNMTNEQLKEGVQLRDELNQRVLLEASGGVTLTTVGAIAETSVDRISVGALTHSAPAIDIGFDWSGIVSSSLDGSSN
ncbi:Nicotinate-nucleotide pyrophosphorylase [carboxylating] [Thalassoglobus neptunius]|uniref:Probable nicotinate-nucleotide pyrophosphorylase [carboxylating] n=1 Tax=Thalassoglobus neptunius TaxID=1938619 RepID=A0A5C5X5T1_9PLAN|nr:carboxylating nicotinate-nucleotide diphosphorylase [Thalassoglobus neptunius]TWT57603.1 Nicotinate-nucleotide pyrophosphorylase [carboxylating] [Thalassoglobus neptunius]